MQAHSKPMFRVGQRVRVLCSTHHPHLVGKVSVVTRVHGLLNLTVANGTTGPHQCYEIEAVTPTPGRYWAQFQLGPVYDGDDPSSWDKMKHLWVPEHLRVNKKELEKA